MRVRGGVWWKMISHGVEISIARGVVEKLRGPTPRCFFLSSFLISCALYFNYGEQRPRAALAMAKKKPHVPRMYAPRHHGKSHQPKSLGQLLGGFFIFLFFIVFIFISCLHCYSTRTRMQR